MADRQLVLSGPLCFLYCKIGKMQSKVLKNLVVNSFNANEVTEARKILMDDALKIQTTDKLPRFPASRRDNENCTAREVDDIFQLLTFLDEKKLLNQLPMYVYDNYDNMPLTRMAEGDMKFFFAYVERMEAKMEIMSKQMDTMARDLYTLRCATQLAQAKPVSHDLSLQPYLSQQHRDNSTHQIVATAAAAPAAPAEARPATSSSRNVMNDSHANVPTYAYTTSSSHNNGAPDLADDDLFPRLPTTENWADIEAQNIDEFRHHTSRRQEYRARRRENRQKRTASQVSETDVTAPKTPIVPLSAPKPKRRAPLVVGKAAGSTSHDNSGIVAAECIVKKSVFYVDNVINTCSVDQMEKFISDNMGVDVLTCFSVAPRKRRNKSDDRAAFRICIKSCDRDNFLDDTKWPEHVCVSEWLFKKHNENTDRDSHPSKRNRIDSQSGQSQPRQSTSSSLAAEEADDMDQTMTACDNSSSVGDGSDPSGPSSSKHG